MTNPVALFSRNYQAFHSTDPEEGFSRFLTPSLKQQVEEEVQRKYSVLTQLDKLPVCSDIFTMCYCASKGVVEGYTPGIEAIESIALAMLSYKNLIERSKQLSQIYMEQTISALDCFYRIWTILSDPSFQQEQLPTVHEELEKVTNSAHDLFDQTSSIIERTEETYTLIGKAIYVVDSSHTAALAEDGHLEEDRKQAKEKIAGIEAKKRSYEGALKSVEDSIKALHQSDLSSRKGGFLRKIVSSIFGGGGQVVDDAGRRARDEALNATYQTVESNLKDLDNRKAKACAELKQKENERRLATGEQMIGIQRAIDALKKELIAIEDESQDAKRLLQNQGYLSNQVRSLIEQQRAYAAAIAAMEGTRASCLTRLEQARVRGNELVIVKESLLVASMHIQQMSGIFLSVRQYWQSMEHDTYNLSDKTKALGAQRVKYMIEDVQSIGLDWLTVGCASFQSFKRFDTATTAMRRVFLHLPKTTNERRRLYDSALKRYKESPPHSSTPFRWIGSSE